MNKFHQLPLWQLPHFDRREYWKLIQDLGRSYEAVNAQLRERNQQLEAALAQIAELQAKLLCPPKTSENASVPPSLDNQRLELPR